MTSTVDAIHHGLQRSGTTWFQNTLNDNFQNLNLHPNDPIIKHDAYRPDTPKWYNVFCITKHPHAWLVSMHRWRGSLDPEVCDKHRMWEMAQTYAITVRSYIHAAEQHDRVHVVRYEDLLREPEFELEVLRNTYPLRYSNDYLTLRKPGMHPEGMDYKSHPDSNQKLVDYYNQGWYYDDLPSEHFFHFTHRLKGWFWGPTLEKTGYNIHDAHNQNYNPQNIIPGANLDTFALREPA